MVIDTAPLLAELIEKSPTALFMGAVGIGVLIWNTAITVSGFRNAKANLNTAIVGVKAENEKRHTENVRRFERIEDDVKKLLAR